jgi:hypothetical protein
VDDDLGNGDHALPEGDGDLHHEGTDGVDDAVLNDFKQGLETGQDDSSGKDETDTSETGGSATDDSREVEDRQDGSATQEETEGGDHDLGSCLEDYQSTLNDSGEDLKETVDIGQDDSGVKHEEDASETGGDSTNDFGGVEGKQDGSDVSAETDSDDHGLAQCLEDYKSTLVDSGCDAKETPDTSQDDDHENRETDSSKSAVDSGNGPGKVENEPDDSVASTEKDTENNSLEQCLADYRDTLDDSDASDAKDEKVEVDGKGSEVSEPSKDGGEERQDSRSGGIVENDKAEPDEKGSSVAEQSKDEGIGAQESATDNGDKGRDDCDTVKGGVESNQQQGSVSDEIKGSEPTQHLADGSEVDDKRGGTSEEVSYGEKGAELPEDNNELFPIRLRDYPELFVGDGVRSLVDEGLMPERDEARLGDNTVLSFDVNEGLRILHDEVSHRIVDVEHDRIGDMDLYRYGSDRGEEFLHIPDQDKLVPPTEMTWYAYPPNTEVNLDKEYKHELLEAAIDKAGGIKALGDELQQRGAEIGGTFVFKHMHDLRDSMPEDKLIPILNYLGRDLDEVNSHIISIGHIEAVKHPEIPFDLGEKQGARLVAARYGDGTLSVAKDHGPTFHYANNDAGMRNGVVESLTNVFSGAHILNREYSNGEVAKVRTGTEIIGYALKRAGAITGSVFEQNPHVPTWIQQGSMEIKHEWLVQAFGDEGYVWPHRGKVCIGRATEIERFLTKDMMDQLEHMEWHERHEFDHYTHHAIACDDLPPELRATIENHPPNLLVDEQILLDSFGIFTKMYAQEIYYGKEEGLYGVNWVLQTKTRDDARRFYEEIGFPQERKQAGLVSMLRHER